jgi:hypothetical protein
VYVIGPVPKALTVAVPLQEPLQVTLLETTVNVGPVGSLRLATKVAVQPAPSRTVREYDPAERFDSTAVVCVIGLQLYVYDGVPPVTVVVIAPFVPEQVEGGKGVNVALIAVGCVIV